MTAATSETHRLRERTGQWLAAIQQQDRDAVLAFYSPSIRSFDVILAQQVRGEEPYRRHWENCMALCNGEPVFQMYDLEITVDGALAVSHGMFHCGCDDENGELQTGWMRGTFVWQKKQGQWFIEHEHLSNAFDPASGELIMDWQPDHQPEPVPILESVS